MENINKLLLDEGVILQNLSERVIRKFQSMRLQKSEFFSFTQKDISRLAVKYTRVTAENVLDNILNACHLFDKKSGKRLIDILTERDGNFNYYPSSYDYFNEKSLEKEELAPIKFYLDFLKKLKESGLGLDHPKFARTADKENIDKIVGLVPKHSYLFIFCKKQFDSLTGGNIRYSYLVKVIAGLNEFNDK